MSILTVLQIAPRIGKLAWFIVLFIPYFQWTTWRAKQAFKDELLKNGLPEADAAGLASLYHNGTRNILTSLLRQPIPSRPRNTTQRPE